MKGNVTIARLCLMFSLLLVSFIVCGQHTEKVITNQWNYLANLKTELHKEWPQNRTINIVFHGHSVPAGYYKTPHVNTLSAYPHLFLKRLKTIYPFAVVNVIVTAIGGENSASGTERFERDVLVHHPDLILLIMP